MKGQTNRFYKNKFDNNNIFFKYIYILQISVKRKSFEMQKFISIVKYNEQLITKKTKQNKDFLWQVKSPANVVYLKHLSNRARCHITSYLLVLELILNYSMGLGNI